MKTRKTLWSKAIMSVLLSTSCAGVSHAQLFPPPPERPQIDDNGVDVVRGEISYTEKDISIGGDGIGSLDYIKYYGNTAQSNIYSSYQSTTPWMLAESIAVTLGNFSQSFDGYTGNSRGDTGNVWPTMAGGFGFTDHQGRKAEFNHILSSEPVSEPAGGYFYAFADYVEDLNGVRWTYHYRSEPALVGNIYRIQSVTSNAGYQLKLYYKSDTYNPSDTGDWGTVSKVVAINNAYEVCNTTADLCSLSLPWKEVSYSTVSATTTATYSDASARQIVQTTSPVTIRKRGTGVDDAVYNFGTVTKPCSFGYCPIGGYGTGVNSRVVTSAVIHGHTWSYSYSFNSTTRLWTTTVTQPDSQLIIYKTYIAPGGGPQSPRINSYTDPLGRATAYTYDGYSNMLTSVLPEGNYGEIIRNSVSNITDTRMHAKPGSLLTVRTEPRSYGGAGACCNKPTSITDPRGNAITYTYAAHGGVLTETGPAVAGVAPVKRSAYAQRYAWIKNSAGGYVQAPTPIWVKTEDRTCRTTATVGSACAGGSTDEVVTSYDYGPNSGPNNLQLRGIAITADGTTRRTCFGYDIFGNKISETKPLAGLTTCS
jgi:YD repeat-containing protein